MLEQRWARIHCHKNLKKNVLEKQNIRGVNLRRKLATPSIRGFPLPKGGGRYSSSNSGKVRVQADKKNIKTHQSLAGMAQGITIARFPGVQTHGNNAHPTDSQRPSETTLPTRSVQKATHGINLKTPNTLADN
jgi:hypothetical protein